MSTIGSRLREIRRVSGLSQEAFGKVGNVSKRAQINYEKDERQPDGAYLRALHESGYDVTYIITGYYADEIAYERAHVEEMDAAEPDVQQMLAGHHATANEWITRALVALRATDGVKRGHLDMIARGLGLDQSEHSIRCADDDERGLITHYRRADARDRQVILNTAAALAERGAPAPEDGDNHVQQTFHGNVDQVAGRDVVNYGGKKKP